MSEEKLYIGIDLGTSGCRAIAIDLQRQVKAEARSSMPEPLQQGAAISQDPQIWWQAVGATLRQLLTQISPQQVAAIAVDGTSSTLLLCKDDGTPVGPALMYNDARASQEAERMERIVPQRSAAHGPSSGLAKLLWLQRSQPLDGVCHVCHQADWIVGQLTGHFDRSDANNCLKLGYDPINKAWPDWLGHLGAFREWMPQVYLPGQPMGPITAEIAERFGLAPTVQVVAGTTDSTAAFIATGAGQVGDAVTSLGSTLVMKVVSAQAIFAPEFGIYSQPLGNRWLVGGGSNSGGRVLRHFFDTQQLDLLSSQIDVSHESGLDFYPLLSPGERFPVCDAKLAPRLTPRPADDSQFLHGLLEGMARIEKQAYQRLAELGAPYPTTLRSAGGGASNPQWSTIRQQQLGVEMIPSQHHEAAYGSALLALQGMTGEATDDQA